MIALCITVVLTETSTTPKKKVRGKVPPAVTSTTPMNGKSRGKVSPTMTSTTPANGKRRSKRPNIKRNQVVVPPVSCPDLYDATIDIGDEGPQIRKSQHNSDYRKYFECVINRWIIRDCAEGTTFNGEDKNCDSTKSCKPSQVADLYADGVETLKSFLGISDREEIY